jgi:2-phosphosulfolactate phosphatase
MAGAAARPQVVRKLHLLAGARVAAGLVVVIDVFRAFTLAPCAFARGASRIRIVAEPEEALALKQEDSGLLLAGERDGRPLAGFDFPNSPAAILRADLAGRTLVLRTSAGVQGLLAVDARHEVVTGSFINADAVVAFIRDRAPAELSLVCMGWNGAERTAEDEACADYLAAALDGRPPDFDPIRAALREDSCGANFFDPARPWFPPEDFDACLRLSALDYVLRRVIDRDGRLWLEPATAPTDAGRSRGAL